jgi:hypothetical protein
MKENETQARNAQRNAAHLLMKEYVINNADYVARVLESILPFFQECTYAGLQSSMNTVNVTFASVALDVIKSTWETDADSVDRLGLPVDANDMKNAIFYLSKIIEKLRLISYMAEKRNDPAIKMCIETNCDCDILGAV